MFSSPQMKKILTPGRLITVSNGNHDNAVAAIIFTGSLHTSSKLTTEVNTGNCLEKLYVVLVLCNKSYEDQKQFEAYKQDLKVKEKNEPQNTEQAKYNHSEQFLSKTLFQPTERSGQVIEEIMAADIREILDKCLKLDTAKIIDNHKKRLIPRFR